MEVALLSASLFFVASFGVVVSFLGWRHLRSLRASLTVLEGEYGDVDGRLNEIRSGVQNLVVGILEAAPARQAAAALRELPEWASLDGRVVKLETAVAAVSSTYASAGTVQAVAGDLAELRMTLGGPPEKPYMLHTGKPHVPDLYVASRHNDGGLKVVLRCRGCDYRQIEDVVVTEQPLSDVRRDDAQSNGAAVQELSPTEPPSYVEQWGKMAKRTASGRLGRGV